MTLTDGERSLSWNLLFIIILWGFGSYVFITQVEHLPKSSEIGILFVDEHPAFMDADWLDFNLMNQRMTFVENFFSYGFFFLGILRMMSVMTALSLMEREQRWSDFWATCETF